MDRIVSGSNDFLHLNVNLDTALALYIYNNVNKPSVRWNEGSQVCKIIGD